MEISDRIQGFLWTSAAANNCNTYLIDGPVRIMIDPGHAHLFRHVELGLKERQILLDAIDLVCCTHCHPDHMEAVRLLPRPGVPMAMHEAEWRLIATVLNPASASLPSELVPFRPNFFLAEGSLSVKGIHLEVFHTPGHSPGSVCLYWPEEKTLWTGDLIFRAGMGRTDLPGGDQRQLQESISRMAALDVERLLPGHGPILEGRKVVQENFQYLDRILLSYL
jgi:glyoxylase-like metal-dependent hydrolase (beta-lactamase superfamily II)